MNSILKDVQLGIFTGAFESNLNAHSISPLLRNDHWCKGLGLTQPKSAAYERYMQN